VLLNDLWAAGTLPEGVVVKNVFVTGAYGLLGTWLVSSLLDEARRSSS